MSYPLMPKATAVWLVDNTALSFEQIAEFCGLHSLEIQAIADGEVAANIIGQNPIKNGELTKEEIERCEGNSTASLKMAKNDLPKPRARSKGPKYTPIAKRGDKPDAISFLLKNHPELGDSQITRLIGTTKTTIENIRQGTHSNMTNITPKDPVTLGLCTQVELNKSVERAQKAAAKAEGKTAKKVEDTPVETEAEDSKAAEA